MSYWKVNEIKKVNKPWGNYRRVIGELLIANTDGIILLTKENDDGRESMAVHDKRNGHMVVKLGFYWVDSEKSKQKALDAIFEKLMIVA